MSFLASLFPGFDDHAKGHALYHAIKAGERDTVVHLLETTDVDMCFVIYRSPYAIDASRPRGEILSMLARSHESRELMTPLEMAVSSDHIEMVHLLLDSKATPPVGEAPRHMSYAVPVRYNERGSVRKADVEINKRVPFVELLLRNKADVDTTFPESRASLLSCAATHGAHEMVRMLLEHRATPKHRLGLGYAGSNCPYCNAYLNRNIETLVVFHEFGVRCDHVKREVGIDHINSEARRLLDATKFQWSPARHDLAPAKDQTTIHTTMVLRTTSPALADIPLGIMFSVFELLAYCD